MESGQSDIRIEQLHENSAVLVTNDKRLATGASFAASLYFAMANVSERLYVLGVSRTY